MGPEAGTQYNNTAFYVNQIIMSFQAFYYDFLIICWSP